MWATPFFDTRDLMGLSRALWLVIAKITSSRRGSGGEGKELGGHVGDRCVVRQHAGVPAVARLGILHPDVFSRLEYPLVIKDGEFARHQRALVLDDRQGCRASHLSPRTHETIDTRSEFGVRDELSPPMTSEDRKSTRLNSSH